LYAAVKPDAATRKVALFKDGRLRLLLMLLGLQRISEDDDPDVTWVIPSSMTAAELQEALSLIQKFVANPPVYDDDKEAEDFIRRKSLAQPRRAAYDDDDSELDDLTEADFLFPAGGPTVRKSDALENLKMKRRRRINEDDDGLTEEQREERRKARHRANMEKLAKIKSDLFVHDSDDTSDEDRDREFFAQEERRRRENALRIVRQARAANASDSDKSASKRKKRKGDGTEKLGLKKRRTMAGWASDSENDSPAASSGSSTPSLSHQLVELDNDNVTEDTPISSLHLGSSQTMQLGREGRAASTESDATTSKWKDVSMHAITDEEEEAPISTVVSRRGRAGFVIESDSE
jgi:replication fork protection complex subunit Tof1/Swi1